MRFSKLFLTAVALTIFSGCQSNIFKGKEAPPVSVKEMPAVRLGYRFDADVPAPADDTDKPAAEERNAAVQADFDSARPLELLDRTLVSPDKHHTLAIYHRVSDVPSEYRLDMYTAEGKLLKKLTSDTMAVHFPETIVWSPDSSSVAFVAMIRANAPDPTASVPSPITPMMPSNTVGDANSETGSPTPPPAPTPAAPTGILAFRTEQIYTCNADGGGVKPLTANEGLIYFYYAWSPDSSMLVALASTAREWKYLDVVSSRKGEQMVPMGRPRVIEKNGRERRLDDNQTPVRPVWSPDSAKIAAAFETQLRIYDAAGTNPTQAAIPLRNQLLISSQAYDRDQARQASGGNAEANTAQPAPDQPLSTLPDEKLLVSYNPIVEVDWTADDLIYVQTAYLKRMRNEADSVRSFSRWHRLALTIQTLTPAR